MSQALIRCKSVTPNDDGALAEIEYALKPLGFECHRLTFKEEGTEPVYNLYARLGTGSPHFCFAGHTDVVPPAIRTRLERSIPSRARSSTASSTAAAPST